MSERRTTRRGVVGWGARIAVLGGLAGHAFAWARSLVPNVIYEPPSRRRLGPPDRFPPGRTFLAEQNLFVVHDKRGFRALSAICSHLGCSVGPSKEGYHCPCHGSRFDATGKNTSGPAPGPLPWHPLTLRGGSLIVDLGKTVGPDAVLPAAGGASGS